LISYGATELEAAFMNLKFIFATVALAAVSVLTQVQRLRAANVKVDAQEVVKIISADKAKTQAYCAIAKLGEQMDQAEQRKDSAKTEELAKKLDEMSQKLGPEYEALVEALQDVDPNSTDGQDIESTLATLNKLCPK
jgi:hypothetical protein